MVAGHRPRSLLQYAIADDLTGAVETAGVLGDAFVQLGNSANDAAKRAFSAHSAQMPVLDVNVREAPASEAYGAVAALPHGPGGGAVFVKIDSLLRGSPGSMLAARSHVAPTVVCPALPAAGRTTVDGRLRVAFGPTRYDGISLSASLAPARLAPVGLDVVRGPRARLGELIAKVGADDQVAVCDARTDADLDRVAAVAEDIPGVCLAGSGGLAAALGRQTGRTPAPRRTTSELSSGAPVLAVVGSAEDSARAQVDHLESAGGARVGVSADSVPAEPSVRAVLDGLGRRPVALTVEPTAIPRATPEAVAARLSAVVSAVIEKLPATRLFLTGGHTARTVLDALGVCRLAVVATLDLATVHCRSDDGREIVTRPGSLGGADALTKAVGYLGATQDAVTASPSAEDSSTEGTW